MKLTLKEIANRVRQRGVTVFSTSGLGRRLIDTLQPKGGSLSYQLRPVAKESSK